MSKAQVARDYLKLLEKRKRKIQADLPKTKFGKLFDKYFGPVRYYPIPLVPLDDDYRKVPKSEKAHDAIIHMSKLHDILRLNIDNDGVYYPSAAPNGKAWKVESEQVRRLKRLMLEIIQNNRLKEVDFTGMGLYTSDLLSAEQLRQKIEEL